MDTMGTANAKQAAVLVSEVADDKALARLSESISETSSFRASNSAEMASTSAELTCFSCSEGGGLRCVFHTVACDCGSAK